MAGNPSALSLGPGLLYYAPLGTALPTDHTTALNAAFLEIGYTDEGSELSFEVSSEPVEVAESLDPVLYRTTGRNGGVTFAMAENTARNLTLAFNGGTVTAYGAAGTDEVQTWTISGTPTGGTFTPEIAGYSAIPSQAYNVSTANLATALTTAIGATVTVTGTAGSSYVVTFPASHGDVPLATFVTAFTGGTTPSISATETTKGVRSVADGFSYEPPEPGQEVRRILVWQSEDGQERWVYPQVFQGGSVTMSRRKGATKTTIPVEFRLERPTDGGAPFQAFYAAARSGGVTV